jgi:hypothetical protein
MIAVVSWADAWGARAAEYDRDYYGMKFPLLHGGPIGAFARTTPTTVIFDKSGTSVAWRTGSFDWTSREIRTVLEALIK